jgi:hypothetical protein
MIVGTTPRISRSATRDHGRPAWREVGKPHHGQAKPDIDSLIADKPKDAYDVVWLIDALGPEEAAKRITASLLLAGDLAADVLGQFDRLVTDQFRDIVAVGPAMYASFLGAADGDAERRHAHGTVAALRKALSAQGIRL